MMVKNNQQTEEASKPTRWVELLNPAVPKQWLLLLAGFVWTGVGILLASLAINWFLNAHSLASIFLALAGAGISIIINRFLFTRIAMKNINRILSSNDRVCLFSFQAWTGYLIVVVMMSMGIMLRSSPIPKLYLAVVYIAIGGALFQASFNYYRHFYQAFKPKDGSVEN